MIAIAACSSLDAGYKPTLTFVVVQKRHHARFFPVEQKDADRTGNCQPGTVSILMADSWRMGLLTDVQLGSRYGDCASVRIRLL